MSRGKALAAIVVSIFGLSSVCAYGAASSRAVEKPTGFTIAGVARNIDRLRESFDVSDYSSTYTILTGSVSIQLQSGRTGTIQDLEDSAYVRVVGERLSERTVLASSIVVIDAKAVAAEIAAHKPQGKVESAGAVIRVAARLSEIDVRTDDGNFVLIVRPETAMRRYIYPTDINDVGEGDQINFVGTMGRDGRILAERIQVSSGKSSSSVPKSYRPAGMTAGARATEDVIEGKITSTASIFDRSLTVQTRYGERSVDVLKTAEVRIDGLRASVHDLSKGDNVRVYGKWDNSTLVADRVETLVGSSIASFPAAPNPARPRTAAEPSTPDAPAAVPSAPSAPEPTRQNTVTGRVIDIDYTNSELVMDVAMNDTKIDGREAVVTHKGSSHRFRELKKGDKIEVKGDWIQDVLKASTIDVVE